MRPERVGRFPRGRLEAASGTGTEWQRSGLVKYDPLTQARFSVLIRQSEVGQAAEGGNHQAVQIISWKIVTIPQPYIRI